MDERVLAESPGRIALGGGGACAVLTITDGQTVRFVVETAALHCVLEDVPLQLSLPEGFCRFEAIDHRLRLEYGVTGAGRGSFSFDASLWSDALVWVAIREGVEIE